MISNYITALSLFLLFCYINAQSVVQNVKLDNKEVRCLVCEVTIKELTALVLKSDKTKTVKVGGHRLDANGNYDAPKSVPLDKSEIYLSELMEKVCNTMDDYVRGLFKSNKTLTLMKMIEDGKMNPHMDSVEFVQDDDLNKSLKYYCESIIEVHEEDIIEFYQGDKDLDKFCVEERVCPLKQEMPQEETDIFGNEDELSEALGDIKKEEEIAAEVFEDFSEILSELPEKEL
ncbi:unnamed protein product [Ceutorhynchus assimilis]|uniref:DUF3456 domain-containing protein n=1 Tax=Ceutorhynchus assimilis TaxID=467358 RepID=A0A9N9MK45_9CUCU|nr:unnamed protein product [Ceutorhynchus assimilis]